MNAATRQINEFVANLVRCKCGHSQLRHIHKGVKKEGANNPTFCVEPHCRCSRFVQAEC